MVYALKRYESLALKEGAVGSSRRQLDQVVSIRSQEAYRYSQADVVQLGMMDTNWAPGISRFCTCSFELGT